jgi:hypothetical protein
MQYYNLITHLFLIFERFNSLVQVHFKLKLSVSQIFDRNTVRI